MGELERRSDIPGGLQYHRPRMSRGVSEPYQLQVVYREPTYCNLLGSVDSLGIKYVSKNPMDLSRCVVFMFNS